MIILSGKQMDNNNPLQGNFALVASWFGASLTGIFFAVFLLIYLSATETLLPKATTYQLYQALPPVQSETEAGIASSDGRAKALADFFKGYSSILAAEASTFIAVADHYHLDWKLLPSIAMQESNGGRKMINDSHNPFGFGIYGSKIIKFESFAEGIETVGRSLRENYLNEGLHTPEQIMTKYTPPSISKGGAWAKGIRSFMEELR